MSELLTVEMCLKRDLIKDSDIDLAVESYLNNLKLRSFVIAPCYQIDPSAALKAHVPSLLVIHDVHARSIEKWNAAKAAILLAVVVDP